MELVARLWQGRRKYISLIVLVGVIILVRLGFWQLERHEQRMARNAVINARIDQAPVPLATVLALPVHEQEYRHVQIVCSFQTNQQLLWRNRSYQGTTGYQILTVCQPDSGDAVLVNRGWIPYQDGLNDWETQYPPVSGLQMLSGIWRLSQPPLATVSEIAPRNGWRDRWFAITIPAIAAQMQRSLAPGFIELQPGDEVATTYPVRSTMSDMGLGSHFGYAIQWFSFAVILLVGAVILAYRRPL
jgi:surfeit locus 1 family protein